MPRKPLDRSGSARDDRVIGGGKPAPGRPDSVHAGAVVSDPLPLVERAALGRFRRDAWRDLAGSSNLVLRSSSADQLAFVAARYRLTSSRSAAHQQAHPAVPVAVPFARHR